MNDIDTGKRSALMSLDIVSKGVSSTNYGLDGLRIGCRIVGHFYRQQEVLGTSHDRT